MEQRVKGNEQKVTSNEQKLKNNGQILVSSEQRERSFTSKSTKLQIKKNFCEIW